MLDSITKPLFFISPDPEKALGLELFVPNLHIIYHNDSPYIDYFRTCGTVVLKCSKNILPVTHKMLNDRIVSEFIKIHSQGQIPEILCFKNSLQIENICIEKKYLLLNNKVSIAKQFENKIFQYTWLKSLHINTPDAKCGELDKLSLKSLFIKWQEKTVLQFSYSHAGLGTHICLPLNKLKNMKVKFPHRKVRLSKFINGENWTINACTTKNGTYIGALSFQYTGFPIATNYLGATIGNDWSCVTRLSSHQINTITIITTKIGVSLYNNGFKGLFGIDFRLNSNDIYVIEVNARQVASIPTHNHLAFQKGIAPLSLLHIAEHKNLNPNDMSKFVEQSLNKKKLSLKNYNQLAHTFKGARLIINNNNIKSIQLHSKPVKNNLYSLKANSFIKKGITIDNLKKSDEILYIPRSLSDIINKDTKVFQLLSKDSMLNDQHSLSSNIVQLIQKLKKDYVFC